MQESNEAPPPTDEELTAALEQLDKFLQSNLGIIPIGLSMSSEDKWKTLHSIWQEGSNVITTTFKLIAYLGSMYWPKTPASNFIINIFNGLAILTSVIKHPKKTWKALQEQAQLAKKEILKIQEDKRKKLEERAAVKVGTVAVRSSIIKAAIKWTKGKVVDLFVPQIDIIIRADTQKILANAAFQKLLTNPELIKTLEKYAPVIAKVIRHKLKKLLSKEAKLIQIIKGNKNPKIKSLTPEEKLRERLAILNTIVKFKESGGLAALSNILDNAKGPIVEYLAVEGAAHLKTVLYYFEISLPEPKVWTKLFAEVGSKVLAKVRSPEFDLGKLGENLLMLSADKPSNPKEADKIDKLAIAGDVLKTVNPLIREVMPDIQQNSEWIRETISKNSELIASQVEKILTDYLKKSQKKPEKVTAQAEPAQLETTETIQTPPSLNLFLQEAIKALSETLITPDTISPEQHIIPGGLSKITTILQNAQLILSKDDKTTGQQKIAAALEAGEFVCQLLEDQHMSAFMTIHLKKHGEALIPILTPIVGEYIDPKELIEVISDNAKRKSLINTFRSIKSDVELSKTKFGSYLDVFEGFLSSKVVRGLLKTMIIHKIKAAFQSARERLNEAKEFFIETLDKGKEFIGKRFDKVEEKLGKANHKIGQVIDKFSDTVSEAAHEVSDKVSKTAHEVKDFFTKKPRKTSSQDSDVDGYIEMQETPNTTANLETHATEHQSDPEKEKASTMPEKKEDTNATPIKTDTQKGFHPFNRIKALIDEKKPDKNKAKRSKPKTSIAEDFKKLGSSLGEKAKAIGREVTELKDKVTDKIAPQKSPNKKSQPPDGLAPH